MKKIFLFSFLFIFCSCNQSQKLSILDYKEKLSIVDYKETPSSSIDRFVSKQSLSGILSKEYYLLKAFFQKDHSHLQLFSHFQGFEKADGIQIEMERVGDKLLISLSVPFYPSRVLFEEENYFSHSNELDLTVEVQNGTNYGFRVRVWENFIIQRGVLWVPQDTLTERNLIADSFEKKMTFYNKGRGLRWGIQLFRARLIEGARVSPRFL